MVATAGANVPILGPLAKTAPSRKAVLFNRQILAEAEPGLLWTDQNVTKSHVTMNMGWRRF